MAFIVAAGLATPWNASSQPRGGGDPVVTQLAAGMLHTCALTVDGDVYCWGAGNNGQLGNANPLQSVNPQPEPVQMLDGNVVALAAGDHHTCALTIAGAMLCWGSNEYGQLGNPATLRQFANPQPAGVATLGSGVVGMRAGARHTCAVTTDGATRCWGQNVSGQVGRSEGMGAGMYLHESPVRASTDVVMSDVAAGTAHSCGRTAVGALQCWGSNTSGQLGVPRNEGGPDTRSTPQDVIGQPPGVQRLVAGRNHSCVLTEAGAARCWGSNRYAQLGRTANIDIDLPNLILDVLHLGSGVSDITAGFDHSCVLTAAGEARCWGSNSVGQLGASSEINAVRPEPMPVPSLETDNTAIVAGAAHTCVLRTNGGLRCWGYNSRGQLGDPASVGGDESVVLLPVDVVTLTGGVLPPQTIDFAPPSALPGRRTYTLDATASSGLPVVFDSWTPDTCGIDGNTLTWLHDGPSGEAVPGTLCGVRASQPGSAAFAPAVQQRRVIHMSRTDVLTVDVEGSGSVDALPAPASGDAIAQCTAASSPCTAIYHADDATALTLTAAPTPATPHVVWSGDCVASDTQPTQAHLDLRGDATCAALFVLETHRITATVVAGQGTVSPPAQDVPHTGRGRVTVTPADGWRVDSVDGDHCTPVAGDVDSWIVAGVVGDCSIEVRFAQYPYRIERLGDVHRVAAVDTPFADPLEVRVVDLAGTPQPGVPLDIGFDMGSGVPGVSEWIRTTDADGIVSVRATANGRVGSHRMIALAQHSADAVAVAFSLDNVDLVAEIHTGVTHAAAGDMIDYELRVRSLGAAAHPDVRVAVILSNALDETAATWTCHTPATGCDAQGSGAFVQEGLTLAPGVDATWTLRVPVVSPATEHGAIARVEATSALGAEAANEDRTPITLFEDDFERHAL